MKSRDYWQKRFELLEAAKNNKSEHAAAELADIFNGAIRETEDKISTWYQRLAKNNNVTMAEARQLLDKNELAEFKWTVDEYIKYGRENAINQQWMKQLENASARVHISRFEALKIQIQNTAEKAYGNQYDIIEQTIKQQYLDGYYKTLFEVQKGHNIGWDIAPIDERQLSKVISKPWHPDGSNFSANIWNDRSGMIHDLHKQLSQTLIQGKSPNGLIKYIAEKYGKNDADGRMSGAKFRAARLVNTESSYFSNLAQKDVYNELDVEKYQILEALDSLTCPECGALDGKVFEMSEFEVSVTAPPFHPMCRGTTIPYFDDGFGERIARDAEGKTYHVPSDMKYAEWKKEFVDGSKKGLSSAEKGVILTKKVIEELNKPGTMIIDKKSLMGGLEEFKKHVDIMPEPYKSVYGYYAKNTDVVANSLQMSSIGYDWDKDAITYNPKFFKLPKYHMPTNIVYSHELAHRYDVLVVKSWENIKFVNAISEASRKIQSDLVKYNSLYKTINAPNPALQDIISALSDNKVDVKYGHSNWDNKTKALEIFANISYMKGNAIEIPRFDGAIDDIIIEFEKMFTGRI